MGAHRKRPGRERGLTSLATSGLILGVSALAHAQATDSARVQAADTPVATLPGVVVEVSRLSVGGFDAARVPFFFTYRSGDEIRRSSTLTVADALSRMPGVHANDELGAASQPDITLRGFSVSPVVGLPQSLSVFVDGVRVNEPDAAQVHFNLIPLHDVERIDVIRGPVGPFGRNTLAGALNIVTRRGGREHQAELQLAGGSFETLDARGQGSGTLGDFDYYASGRYLRSEGWRDVTGARFSQLFAKVGRRSGRSDFWISYSFASDSVEQAGSLPKSWLEGSLPAGLAGREDPRKINFTGGDYFTPLLHFITANYSLELSPRLSLQSTTFYRRNEVEQFNANITEANSRGLSRLWSAGATGQIAYQPRPVLTLLGGLEYVRDDVDARIFAEPNPAAADSGLTTHVTTQQDAFGAFGQAWWLPAPRFSLLASLRYDQIRIPFRDLLDPANNGTNTFRQVTASFGADYFLTDEISVYGSYGHGFRAPVILELACADPEDPCPLPFELGADPPLDPVTTDTWQLGMRLTPAPIAAFEVVGYWSEVHDEIFNVVAPPTTRGFFQNIDRTRRQGVDLRGTLQPHARLSLHGDLSYTRATFQSEATLAAAFLDEEEPTPGDPDPEAEPPVVQPGDAFPLVPELRASLGASYEDGSWRLALEGSYVGSQWLRSDEDNTEEEQKLDPHFVVDAAFERAIGPATVFLRVENVLDSSYESFGVIANNPLGPGVERIEPFLTPGFPRRLYAGARWSW